MTNDQENSRQDAAAGIVGAPHEAGLFRLVYMSQNVVTGTQDAIESEIRDILAASRRNNRAANITGALIFSSGSFLQTLEGPIDAIEALYEHIAVDVRHAGATIVEACDIEKRDFGEWSMAFSGENVDEQARFKALIALGNDIDRAKAANVILAHARLNMEDAGAASEPVRTKQAA